MRKVLFLLFFLFLHLIARSQDLPGVLDELRLLSIDNQLPKDLLSTRSVVFISVPDTKGKLPQQGNWQSFAMEAHRGFKRVGVDAVAYFNLRDVRSGLDSKSGFLGPIDARKIENLIFITKREELLGTEVELIITKKLPDRPLVSLDQQAYRVTRNVVGELISQLGRDIYQGQLVNKNFLIPDQPEFFTDAYVVRGRRNENFNSDLRIGKLAVPMFQKYTFPKGVDSTRVAANKLQMINSYNEEVDRANAELEQILSIYPFKYELVDYTQGEEHLYRREFSYVLMSLNTTGLNIRKLLNYEIDPTETDYMTLKTISEGVTTLEQIPVNTPVFKYYMKQLVSKEVYLGKQWDADLSWQQALTNHLSNFKEFIDSQKKQ